MYYMIAYQQVFSAAETLQECRAQSLYWLGLADVWPTELEDIDDILEEEAERHTNNGRKISLFSQEFHIVYCEADLGVNDRALQPSNYKEVDKDYIDLEKWLFVGSNNPMQKIVDKTQLDSFDLLFDRHVSHGDVIRVEIKQEKLK